MPMQKKKKPHTVFQKPKTREFGGTRFLLEEVCLVFNITGWDVLLVEKCL